MAITPWPLGNRASSWLFLLALDSGIFSTTGLTTSNFTLYILNKDVVGATPVAGTGTFSNLTAGSIASGSIAATPATITYAPSATDVGTLGNFHLYIDVSYGGGIIQTLEIGDWQVVPK